MRIGADPQVVVVDELLLRGDRPGVERGGHRERLHDRSGLVLARDGRVAEELAVGGGEVVRVVRRVAGHRQDRAGLGVHDHAGRPRGTVQPVRVPDRLLEDVLDAEVQGQAQVGAVDRVEEQRRRVGDLPADDVLLGAHRPRRPGEQRVLAGLDAVLALAVDVDEAEQLGRQRRVLGDALDRVDALGLGQHADAAQVERADALGRLGADRAASARPSRGRRRRRARSWADEMSRTGASRRAARAGSSISGGVAKTDWSSTEVASSAPLASVISPRSAGSCSCCESWPSAIADSHGCWTTCHQTRRAPIADATNATTRRRTRARARLSVLASMSVSVRRPRSAAWDGSIG